LSNREKQKLSENGYVYAKNKKSADGKEVFWNCEKRTSDKCLKAIVPLILSSEGARPGHQPPGKSRL